MEDQESGRSKTIEGGKKVKKSKSHRQSSDAVSEISQNEHSIGNNLEEKPKSKRKRSKGEVGENDRSSEQKSGKADSKQQSTDSSCEDKLHSKRKRSKGEVVENGRSSEQKSGKADPKQQSTDSSCEVKLKSKGEVGENDRSSKYKSGEADPISENSLDFIRKNSDAVSEAPQKQLSSNDEEMPKTKRKRSKGKVRDKADPASENSLGVTKENPDVESEIPQNQIDSYLAEKPKSKRKRSKGEVDENNKNSKKKSDKSESSSKLKRKRSKGEVGENNRTSEQKSSEKKRKSVRFADKVEVLNAMEGDGLVRGKRFTKEEDDMIRKAIAHYIESRNLGENGIQLVLYSKGHPELRHCWKEIGSFIPHRPSQSVYWRAHVLFERDAKGTWTEEENEILKKFHAEHGPDWKRLAKILGKQRVHIKDQWRRKCNPNVKTGRWEQDEYQTLFDLVNLDLQAKVLHLEKKPTKHGMLRDDIPWTAISTKLGTRNQDICCMKWYNVLTSPMVAEGKWYDSDDYRLVKALNELQAVCMEDVDWDELIEHRSGYVCRERWMQMVKHVDFRKKMSFSDQVKVLAERYCPDRLPDRVTFDNLPFGP